MFKIGDLVVYNHDAGPDLNGKYGVVQRIEDTLVWTSAGGQAFFNHRHTLVMGVKASYKEAYKVAQELKVRGRSTMRLEALKAAIIAKATGVAPIPVEAPVKAAKPLPEPLSVWYRKKVGDEKISWRDDEISSFAFELPGGDRVSHTLTYCHAKVVRWGSIAPVALVDDIKQFWISHHTPDLYEKYADYIVNRSVFRNVFLTKDWKEQSLNVNIDLGVSEIMAALICLRHGWERRGAVESFNFFVKQGFCEETSLLMSQCYLLYKNHWIIATFDGGHSLFSDQHATDDLCKFVVKGMQGGVWEFPYRKMSDGLKVFRSIAPMKREWDGGPYLLKALTFDHYKTIVIGKGWDAKTSVDQDLIVTMATIIQNKVNHERND